MKKRLYTLLAILSMPWMMMAQQITGLNTTIWYSWYNNYNDSTINMAASEMPEVDLTDSPTSSLSVDFEAETTEDVLELKLIASIHSADQEANIDQWDTLTFQKESNGKWKAYFYEDLVERIKLTEREKRTIEFYVIGQDSQKNDLKYDNGGEHYKIKFYQSANGASVQFCKGETASVRMKINGEPVTYTITDESVRTPAEDPSNVKSLAFCGYTIDLICNEGYIPNICEATMSLKFYEEGESDDWWNISGDGVLEDEIFNTETETYDHHVKFICNLHGYGDCDFTDALKPGHNYKLEFRFQVYDECENYFLTNNTPTAIFNISVDEMSNISITQAQKSETEYYNVNGQRVECKAEVLLMQRNRKILAK